MRIAGEQEIAASQEAVWAALNDAEVLRRSIPGCESLSASDEGFAAVVSVRIGPIGARFSGTVAIENPDQPNGYRLVGQGQGGMAGSARGSADVTLQATGSTTLLSYVVDAEVGGRLAQLGGPVIEATARKLAAEFFARFEQVVTGKDEAAAPGAPARQAAPARPAGFPIGWILALLAATVLAYMAGGGELAGNGEIGLLAMALLLILATAIGFEFGRRR